MAEALFDKHSTDGEVGWEGFKDILNYFLGSESVSKDLSRLILNMVTKNKSLKINFEQFKAVVDDISSWIVSKFFINRILIKHQNLDCLQCL